MKRFRKLLGERIRQLRKAQGLTQEVLAERTGLHNTYIGAIERGERNPSLESCQRIATKLGLSLSELLVFPSERKPTTERELLITKIRSLLEKQSSKNLRVVYKLLDALIESLGRGH